MLVQTVVGLAPAFVAVLQIEDERLLVLLAVMDQAGQPVEPGLFEAVEHHVERRALFADEQHAFAARGIVGDQVGDGLRFAGTRRPLDDEAAPGSRQRDRSFLGGVCWHDAPQLVGRQRRGRRFLDDARFDREDRVECGRGDRIVDQLIVIADQRHLLVIEIGERDLGQIDLPVEPMPLSPGERVGHRFGLGRHPVGPRRHRCADRDALGQRAGTDVFLEQGEAERAIIVALIAVLRTGDAHRASARVAASLKGAQALHRFLVDQFDLGLGDQRQLHAGFAARDLCRDIGLDRFDRSLRQIDPFGQLDIVKLAQIMA